MLALIQLPGTQASMIHAGGLKNERVERKANRRERLKLDAVGIIKMTSL